MALTTCPDCGRQVSTEAVACPGCGRPMVGSQSSARPMFEAQSSQPTLVMATKSRGVYIILGILVGLLGIHNFYAGYYGRGAVQLLITLLLGWLIVGLIITGLWVLVELFSVTKDSKGNELA